VTDAGREFAPSAKPRLLRGVRLKHDEVRGGYILLAPERVVRADPIAVAVLQRCDGIRSFADIVDELCAVYKGDRERIENDVRVLLVDLFTKRMIGI